MSDPKKKKQTDSTTDFFLQFMKEEKSDKEKTEAKKEEREQTYTKTVEKFSSGYNYFNKLLDKLLANKSIADFTNFQIIGNSDVIILIITSTSLTNIITVL